MAVNSPGNFSKHISSRPTSPRPSSPCHFVFPQKSPNTLKKSSDCSDIRSPKSPRRFDFDKTLLPNDVYDDFFSDNTPKSPQCVLKSCPKKSAKTHITTNPTYQMMCYSSSNSTSGMASGYVSNDTTQSKLSARRSRLSSSGNTEATANTNATGNKSAATGSTKAENRARSCKTSLTDVYVESTTSDDQGSVSNRRYRKSTSDLTDMAEIGTPPVTASPRRRGSSKGGLAYLASRRGSRDSVKSQASNMSAFSNEDVGPLAFQKSARGRTRRTSNFLELPVPDHARPRVCSLPERPYNPRMSDDLYRLRTFSITSKGSVVNCGDSIISRRSRSNTSVNSTASRASDRSPFETCCPVAGYVAVGSLSQSDSNPSSPMDPEPNPKYRVVMLGDAGVGKTALVSQFMTSEYMNTYDASLDDEFGEKTVSILLDGEESEMCFIDHPSVEMSVENSLSTYEPHACIVVYSIVARSSLKFAEDTLNYLWRENVTRDKAVIVVGNKADLARSRAISVADGKALAASRDTKFIETSSGIQHNVDELLVGILKQIRLKENRDKKKTTSKMSTSKTHLSLHLAKEILHKMCINDISKSKSCENLHVL